MGVMAMEYPHHAILQIFWEKTQQNQNFSLVGIFWQAKKRCPNAYLAPTHVFITWNFQWKGRGQRKSEERRRRKKKNRKRKVEKEKGESFTLLADSRRIGDSWGWAEGPIWAFHWRKVWGVSIFQLQFHVQPSSVSPLKPPLSFSPSLPPSLSLSHRLTPSPSISLSLSPSLPLIAF